jgi:hypothetical protein
MLIDPAPTLRTDPFIVVRELEQNFLYLKLMLNNYE